MSAISATRSVSPMAFEVLRRRARGRRSLGLLAMTPKAVGPGDREAQPVSASRLQQKRAHGRSIEPRLHWRTSPRRFPRRLRCTERPLPAPERPTSGRRVRSCALRFWAVSRGTRRCAGGGVRLDRQELPVERLAHEGMSEVVTRCDSTILDDDLQLAGGPQNPRITSNDWPLTCAKR